LSRGDVEVWLLTRPLWMAGYGFLSFPSRPDRPWGPPNPMGTGKPFYGDRAAGESSWPLVSI
jgi:hypothetical protein